MGMTNFRRDLLVITENVGLDPYTNHITFRFRHSQRIESLGVEALGLEARGYNGLRRNKIDTVGSVMNKWGELKKLSYVGDNTVKAIKNAVMSLYYDTLTTEEKKQFWRDAFGE